MDGLVATADKIERAGTRMAVRVGDTEIVAPTYLRGYADLRDKLIGTPRFLFDDKAINTAVELTLGRPKILREALRHLVIPYPLMWIEWRDAARRKLRERVEVEDRDYKELRPMPIRVGFLLDTRGGDGRRGTATWLWTAQAQGVDDLDDWPVIGQIQPYFDLDRQFVLPAQREQCLSGSFLWAGWEKAPVQMEALRGIWQTAEHRPSDWGREYFDALSAGPRSLVVELAYSDTVGELIQMYACLLLLTASRPVLDLTPVCLDKLNKARRRKGETALLDYTNVSLYLNPEDRYSPIVRGPLGYDRKSPRIHMVSSYLARRGNKHWCVQPYWRGQGTGPSGSPLHRRVSVRG